MALRGVWDLRGVWESITGIPTSDSDDTKCPRRIVTKFGEGKLDIMAASSGIMFDETITVLPEYGIETTADVQSAVYVIADGRNSVKVRKVLGGGISVLDNNTLRIKIDDTDISKPGLYYHQLVLYNQAGDKLPPEFFSKLRVKRVLEV